MAFNFCCLLIMEGLVNFCRSRNSLTTPVFSNFRLNFFKALSMLSPSFTGIMIILNIFRFYEKNGVQKYKKTITKKFISQYSFIRLIYFSESRRFSIMKFVILVYKWKVVFVPEYIPWLLFGYNCRSNCLLEATRAETKSIVF
jgi:hypothetical protein